jgi:hypothetical protein
VFDNSPIKNLFACTLLRDVLHQWMQLQRHEEVGKMLKQACGMLETLVMQIFAKFGWRLTGCLSLFVLFFGVAGCNKGTISPDYPHEGGRRCQCVSFLVMDIDLVDVVLCIGWP